MKTDLCKLMTKHGSDKGSGVHNYTEYYFELFKDMKDEYVNIFELGLGTNFTDVSCNMGIDGKPGASLRGWKEFFINSNVYGSDIDKRILFEEKRIKTFFCDQTNATTINEMWNDDNLKNLEFDIIIDDGLHIFEANMTFLINSLHKLKKGGFFIVEDLLPRTITMFENSVISLKEKFPNHNFEIVKIPNPNNHNNDNNLLVVKKN